MDQPKTMTLEDVPYEVEFQCTHCGKHPDGAYRDLRKLFVAVAEAVLQACYDKVVHDPDPLLAIENLDLTQIPVRVKEGE